METLIYETGDRVARLTLNRPERGNGITAQMPVELGGVRRAGQPRPRGPRDRPGRQRHRLLRRLRPRRLGRGRHERAGRRGARRLAARPGDDRRRTTLPDTNWDPVTDYQFMSRNVRGFMSLFHSEKPVLCKVHGYCVAGGTDMALCSDLLVIAEDAKIGYPPARVWGSPTTAMWASRLGPMRAKRLLLTGDSLTGAEAAEWGLATEAAPAAELDERFERLLERVARMPINQLVMMKLLVNQTVHAQGLAQTQVLGTFFDGIARHTEEGHGFVRRAAEYGLPRGGARARRALRRPRARRVRPRPGGIGCRADERPAAPELDDHPGVGPGLPSRQLPRRTRDRAARGRGHPRPRQDRRRQAPPAPRRLRPRRRLDCARRHRRRLVDLPLHPARPQLHHDRAEAERLRRRRPRRRDRGQSRAPARRQEHGRDRGPDRAPPRGLRAAPRRQT